MISLLSFLQKLSLAFAVGKMLFFVSIFAPKVFKILERPDAAKLQGALFPPYYFAGFLCMAVFLATTALIQWKAKSYSQWTFPSLMVTAFVCLAIFAYSRWSLTPLILDLQAQLYSDAVTPEIQDQFRNLHSLSVKINGAALLGLLVLLFLI